MSKYFIKFSIFLIRILYCYKLRFNNWIRLTGRQSACNSAAIAQEVHRAAKPTVYYYAPL